MFTKTTPTSRTSTVKDFHHVRNKETNNVQCSGKRKTEQTEKRRNNIFAKPYQKSTRNRETRKGTNLKRFARVRQSSQEFVCQGSPDFVCQGSPDFSTVRHSSPGFARLRGLRRASPGFGGSQGLAGCASFSPLGGGVVPHSCCQMAHNPNYKHQACISLGGGLLSPLFF